jgi:hypothetical protein
MFIGHLALGLAAKRATPHVSLAMLLIASQLADMLWPVFVATGLEQVRIQPGITAFTPLDFVSYPYSHSLLLLVIWGLVLGVLCRFLIGGRAVIGVIAALVVSHWVLDFVSHRPDMPLYPGGGPKLGLGLWNSIPATMVVEMIMYGVGLWIYVRATRARDAVGRWAFVSLALFLVVAYVANVGAVPPSVPFLWISAIAGAAILTLWAWWADRHRDSSLESR